MTTTFNPNNLAARRNKNGTRARNTPNETASPPAGDAAAQTHGPPPAAPPTAENAAAAGFDEDHAEVAIDIPLGDPGSGYASGRIDFQGTPRQAAAAKMLAAALEARGERYAGGTSQNPDGTLVENANGAVRWLLDRIADGFEAEFGTQLTQDYNLIFR